MQLTWTGTAGFHLHTGGESWLIDPYGVLGQTVADIQNCGIDRILITHGHFDHAMEVPALAEGSGASVHCAAGTGRRLVRHGLSRERLYPVTADGQVFNAAGGIFQAFFSRHIMFDAGLVWRSLVRMGTQAGQVLRLAARYPAGRVLSWRIRSEGLTLHHFGSAGATDDELRRLAGERLDVLLFPCQGHTRIAEIAAEAAAMLRPRVFVPHHYDDFLPRMSEYIDPGPIAAVVRRACPGTEVIIPAIGEPLPL